jgi:choline dehydrogenase-like flavoprotein
MGCPTNAKQSMLVTTIPAALARGATLVTRVRAWAVEHGNARASTLHCVGLDPGGTDPTTRKITVRASTYIVSAGAIGSPALLIRSKAPDPHGVVGKRTFLHPTVVSAALMPDRVDGFAGAPQSIYSDHYLELPSEGPLGYKLEAPPLHPILVATTLPGHGAAHANWMRQLAHMHVLIALMRDGFHTRSAGGSVGLNGDGSPVLDYRLDEFFWEGARRAFASMAEIQFAAGAKTVMPLDATAASYSSWPAAKAGIATLALEPLQTSVVSAHVMGGCPLGPDPKRAVTDQTGRHHHLENLYVFDGSLFPTSVGANPQLSIYGITAKLATELAARLAPRRLG